MILVSTLGAVLVVLWGTLALFVLAAGSIDDT